MLGTNLSRSLPGDRVSALTQALTLHKDAQYEAASLIYRELHEQEPRDAEVLFLMGLLCCDLAAFEPACRFLAEAVAIAGVFPEALLQLVVALNAQGEQALAAGRAEEARHAFTQALMRAPGNADALRGLGRVAFREGDAAAAEMHLLDASSRDPAHAEGQNWLGLAQLELGKFGDAETALSRALNGNPRLIQARNNLGLALQQQGRLAEAQSCFEAALFHDSTYAKARINLANVLRLSGKPEWARWELETVLVADPDAVDALNNLGAVFQDLGETELARKTLMRSLELSPTGAQIRWNLSLTQLQLGDFAQGWRNFEYRWSGCDTLRGRYPMPAERAWLGQSIGGKRLLLWAEQGLGDTIQFVRFASDVANLGAVVSILAPQTLVELLRSVEGVSDVIPIGDPPPAYDFHCPLMSLPDRLRIGCDPVQLHASRPYLRPSPGRIERWRPRMAEYEGFKVGIVWSGNSRAGDAGLAAIDRRRSVPLTRFAPLFDVQGCVFFSLQKGDASAEKNAMASPFRDFSDEWADFSDTAGFIAHLDLVISVDTAVAHLAGAMGRPVWLLNRFDSCWRWLKGRDDSPWYATLRQFRQLERGDWEAVMARVAAALAEASIR